MRRVLPLLVLSLLGACAGGTPDGAAADRERTGALVARDDYRTCTEPRPEICTQVYEPVCAVRSTGVVCVTEPCDGALEEVTRSNRCTACSDPDVLGVVPGACGTADFGSPTLLEP